MPLDPSFKSILTSKRKRVLIHWVLVSLIMFYIARVIFHCDSFSLECGYIIGTGAIVGAMRELVR